jgi:endoglycosylceramidase
VDIVTEASVSAYQDIFDNNHGMLDDFVAFWSHAAQQFKDVPGIIGYDVINEPFAGNFYKDPALLLPGVAGKKNLQRLYDTVAAAIRKYDHRHIIFYEPTTWGMVRNGTVDGSGFQHVPGGNAYRNRSAYSYHYYCHSFLPDFNGHPAMQKHVCDKGLAPLIYEAVQEDVNRLGGAAMQTEGMQCNDAETECEDNREALDQRLLSWIDWNYGDNGTEADSRARTYAYAVAGLPLNMSFDPQTKEFNFCFQIEPTVIAPTEIFASTKYNYPHGFAVKTSINVKATTTGDLVFVTPAAFNEANNAVGLDNEACVHIYQPS